MTTAGELLVARADDERPALLFEDMSYSWRDVVAAAAGRARVARDRLDSSQPPHVGVMLENTPEFVFWILAAALDGFTVVGINMTRRGAELMRDIEHTRCQLVVTEQAHVSLLTQPVVPVVCADEDRMGAAEPSLRAFDERSPLLLLFTSGSTGAPKAVICSHGRLARIGQTAGQLFDITRDDVLYNAMPLYHGNAVMANLAPALAYGATVALRRTFSASGFLPDVRRYRATYFNYVGRALAYVLATPPKSHDRDNALRLGFGTEATAKDIAAFEARFGCRILETYGSSEGVISMTRPAGTPPAAMGLPQPGADVVVADPETGGECLSAQFGPDGRLLNAHECIGELVSRNGVATFEGYWDNPEANHDRLRGGWYWSGDLAYRDADGYFYFAGRSNDWLRVDSENFAAAPVERILARFPGVVMVAVYAVPDPRTGDQVMAALEMEHGALFDPAAFGEFLGRQPDLGTKWAPRFVRVVDAMPLTGNNKVDKTPLRRGGWRSDERTLWRPGRALSFAPFDGAARADWEAQFAEHGRAHLLPQ